MILIIDNYDSFVYNLARYVEELGGEVEVIRNDVLPVARLLEREPEGLILSPGPGLPEGAGVGVELVRAALGRLPILGVCLGHQILAEALGGRTVQGREPLHGQEAEVVHDGTGLLKGLPSPLRAGRYHSLVVEEASLPRDLRVTGRSHAGEIMAMTHRTLPATGVQFHPESILTEGGHLLLGNFLASCLPSPAPGGV